MSLSVAGSARDFVRRHDDGLSITAATFIAAMLAAMLGLLGLKAAIAVVTGLLVLTALLVAPRRSTVLMVATVLSFTLLLHKKFGPLVLDTQSGANGLVISSINVVVAMLYAGWIFEGTFRTDVLRALRRPVFWTPPLGLLLYSFSIEAAPNGYLAVSELFRLGWVYLLFLYFGARVRRRSEIFAIFGALGAFALIQLPIVTLQFFTGGVLGLEFLGVPTQLIARDTDAGSIGRPMGTLVHPVFLCIVLTMISLVALSLALFHDRRGVRVAALALIPLCGAQIMMAQARGPLLGLAAGAVVVLLAGAARHRISPKAALWGLAAGGAGVIVLWPQISSFWANNFGSNHLDVEIQSRLQLNEIGYRMIEAHPLAGVGLNNFTQVMDRYTIESLLFPGFPSHNLFVLTAAETGLLGLTGLLVIGAALLWNALRLSRSRDPLYRAVGWAMVGVLVANLVAEQLSYSLRQEVPLALFWLLAGLTMACLRMQEDDRARAVRTVPAIPAYVPARAPLPAPRSST
jgi:O-antigen ligase